MSTRKIKINVSANRLRKAAQRFANKSNHQEYAADFYKTKKELFKRMGYSAGAKQALSEQKARNKSAKSTKIISERLANAAERQYGRQNDASVYLGQSQFADAITVRNASQVSKSNVGG